MLEHAQILKWKFCARLEVGPWGSSLLLPRISRSAASLLFETRTQNAWAFRYFWVDFKRSNHPNCSSSQQVPNQERCVILTSSYARLHAHMHTHTHTHTLIVCLSLYLCLTHSLAHTHTHTHTHTSEGPKGRPRTNMILCFLLQTKDICFAPAAQRITELLQRQVTVTFLDFDLVSLRLDSRFCSVRKVTAFSHAKDSDSASCVSEGWSQVGNFTTS